ncbi:MAG: ROK family protein [Casimicrobiaceae bacterium]
MRIGVDLGGTKIEVAAFDADRAERARRREATPAGDYAGTVACIVRLVAEVERSCGLAEGAAPVGVAAPGTLSRSNGLMRGANSVCLNGMPLRRDLETGLGRVIGFANDANCFALSEATDGAGRDADVVFGVIVGTGVGGGLVVDGKLVQGANGIAGEWGHNPLPWPGDGEHPGPKCFCGQRGCIETWLSGPALARDAGMRSAEAVVSAARAGDARCELALERYEMRLARALGHVINIVDPDVIVLGGGLSNVERWYASVPRCWHQHVFSDRVDTRLARHVHGDSSGVRGAAWLAAGVDHMPA